MATRRELQKLSCLRLREAEALSAAGCYDECAYLCGYVVELALKAVICARFGVNEYPEKRLHGALRTHELEDLKLISGLDQDLSSTVGRVANWSVASEWKPDRRYQPEGSYDQAAAQRMPNAIGSYPDGVLACISSHW